MMYDLFDVYCMICLSCYW